MDYESQHRDSFLYKNVKYFLFRDLYTAVLPWGST